MNENLLQVKSEITKVLRGKEDCIDQILCCMLAGGHILLEDIPVSVEGRADGIWTDKRGEESLIVIDEIKGTYRDLLHRCSYLNQVSVRIIKSDHLLPPTVCHQTIDIFGFGV